MSLYYHLYIDQHPPNCGICSQTLPRLAKQRTAYSSSIGIDYNSDVGEVEFQVRAPSKLSNDKIINHSSGLHETKHQEMQRLNRIFWHELQDPTACLDCPDDQFLGVISRTIFN
jgi:hypothetical protein